MRRFKVFCFSLVFGPCLNAGEFTYENIIELINSNKVTSIESLLPLLPTEFRSNYTLMHTSRSLQKASPENPRVILYGNNAKLTCAFNGDSSQRGFDLLECFQFRESESKFDFRQIKFPTQSNGLTEVLFSQPNRTADGKISCTSCHAADPRPNWNHYNIWDGAYGGNDDFLGNSDLYPKFVARRNDHPRYKWLIQENDSEAPYRPDSDSPLQRRPNLRLSDALNRLNSLRTSRILKSNTVPWETLAFSMGAIGCSLSTSQLQQIQNAGLSYDQDTDLNRIFGKLNIQKNHWSTQIFKDPNLAPPWEFQSGVSFLAMNTAMAIVNEKAKGGNIPFQKGIQEILAKASSINNPYKKDAFYRGLDEIVPDLDVFGDFKNNAALICPELSNLFMQSYLSNN